MNHTDITTGLEGSHSGALVGREGLEQQTTGRQPTGRQGLRRRWSGQLGLIRTVTAAIAIACTMPMMRVATAQQTLARGVTMSEMSATKQTDTQVTTLHTTAVNNSGKPIGQLSIRFELYDAANRVVGEATATRANLAPGETWQATVDTSVQFTRFTVMNVDAQ